MSQSEDGLTSTTMKYMKLLGLFKEPEKRINDETVVLKKGLVGVEPDGGGSNGMGKYSSEVETDSMDCQEEYQDCYEEYQENYQENEGVVAGNDGSMYYYSQENCHEDEEMAAGDVNFSRNDENNANFNDLNTGNQEFQIENSSNLFETSQKFPQNFNIPPKSDEKMEITFEKLQYPSEIYKNHHQDNGKEEGNIDNNIDSNQSFVSSKAVENTLNPLGNFLSSSQDPMNLSQYSLDNLEGTMIPEASLNLLETSNHNEDSSRNFHNFSSTSSTQNPFKVPQPKHNSLKNLSNFQNNSMVTTDIFKSSFESNSIHGMSLLNESLDPMNKAGNFSNLTDRGSLSEFSIDETMVPERCRTNRLEQSIMHHEKLNVSTFYRSGLTRSTGKLIESYYKFQRPNDWNEVAEEMIENLKLEPSIDYLYEKLKAPKDVNLGDEHQRIEDELEMDDIHESLKEIEKSFEASDSSFVSSTPTKADTSRGSNGKVQKSMRNSQKSSVSASGISRKFTGESIQVYYEPAGESENVSQTQREDPEKSATPKVPEALNNLKVIELSENSQKPGTPKDSEASGNSQAKQTQKSLDTSRRSQRLLERQKQQYSKSVSDIFRDIDTTQDSVMPKNFSFQLNHSQSDDDNKNQSSSGGEFYGFSIQEQEESREIVDSLLPGMIQSDDPVELLQALTQDNPILFDARRAAILSQVENIFLSLLQSFVDQKPLVLKIRTVRSWKDCEVSNEILSQNEVNVTKRISFGNKKSEKSFAVMVVVMCEIYKILSRGSTCTKREIYYRDVELFGNQETVNKAVNNLCAMLNVQEFELGLTASSKGLIAGDLTIVVGDERIDCSNPRAVPSNPSEITSFESSAKFVLVVEKDTVFQRIVTDEIFNRSPCKPILITGKGYPDINTRVLLKKLSTETFLPIYIIVDADPHGIEIMFTYKFGSKQMVHNSEHLAVPSIHWIGIHPSDIEGLDIADIDMTDADLKKVDDLLERPYIDSKTRQELNVFKRIKLKAEIESLYHFSTDFLINDFIPRKIRMIEMPPVPSLRLSPF